MNRLEQITDCLARHYGNPLVDAERVRLRFHLPGVATRTDWLITQPSQNGLYVASSQEMVVVGDWQVEVDIRQKRCT